MIGRAAITQRDDGSLADPRTDADWLEWVAAGAVRNWCSDDLLADMQVLQDELLDYRAGKSGVGERLGDRRGESNRRSRRAGRYGVHQIHEAPGCRVPNCR